MSVSTGPSSDARDDLYLLVRHCNLSARTADQLLREKVYSSRMAWQKFLRIFLLTLGVGFTAAGIIFFFAYNWADLHKFMKLGVMEVLLIATTLFALFTKTDKTLKRFVLTGAAILVGVLFAVYGQIYQTGANAYDFFLAWTICITIWVIAARFAPLWLLYLLLINVTLLLYSVQVAWQWSGLFTSLLLFLVQWVVLVITISLPRFSALRAPAWFTQTVALSVVSYATGGLMLGIFDSSDPYLPLLLIATVVCYAWLLWEGWRHKNLFYLALTGFSLVLLLCALILHHLDDTEGIVLTGIVIIGGITLLIKSLLHLQKKWTHGS